MLRNQRVAVVAARGRRDWRHSFCGERWCALPGRSVMRSPSGSQGSQRTTSTIARLRPRSTRVTLRVHTRPAGRMTGGTQGWWTRSRYIRRAAVGGAAVGMWHMAAQQLSGGIVDVAVFAPPAAVLGLAATWAAHIFAPHRFTWRRGLAGALTTALLFSPLTAAAVTFAAAWDPASFLVLFSVGAWFALASGLAVGAGTAVVRWTARWWRRRAPSARYRRPAPRALSRVLIHVRSLRGRHRSTVHSRTTPC